MRQSPLSALWGDLWSDLHESSVLWQVGALLACLALGWALGRLLRKKLNAYQEHPHVIRLGVESFSRVLAPLLALALLAAVKPVLAQWHHVNLLRVAIPLLGSFASIRLVFYVLRRVFARSGTAGSFLLLFEKLFAILAWGAVALYITGLWPELVRYLERTEIPVGPHPVSLLIILQVGASVVVTLIVALWAGAVLEERLMRMEGVHSSLRVVMARLGRAVFILLAILISLSLVGIDLTVLSVFGGALGVGLGLGLQKIASSYVSGFVILLERSLSIGDLVAFDKYSGLITQINTRYTIVRGLDGIETVVPNQILVSAPVQNYSLTDRALHLATRITVGYQTDVESALGLLVQAAAGVARVSREPAPQSYLMKFDADGFELELGFWISDVENGRSNVLSEVNRAIWRTFREHRIEVARPRRELRLLGGAQLDEAANPCAANTVVAP